ncbi:MAG: hypothetical protein NXI22_20790, partial [bacterium]|nr:hypothetical protein [bacterium]
SDTVWLPLFPFPIDGEPRQNVEWSGASVEVAGVAAAKIGLAKYPYVLQYGRTDVRGRLQQGDLILISQVANADAEFHIIGYRKSWFLARANADGDWIRAADGKVLPGDCPEIGHCVGVVWSALT